MREASRPGMECTARRRYPQDVLIPWMAFMGKDDRIFNEQRIAVRIDSGLGR
jgi:hypothetical protein